MTMNPNTILPAQMPALQAFLSTNYDPSTSAKRNADALYDAFQPPVKRSKSQEPWLSRTQNGGHQNLMPWHGPNGAALTREEVQALTSNENPRKRKCGDRIIEALAAKQAKLKIDSDYVQTETEAPTSTSDSDDDIISQYCSKPNLDNIKKIEVFLPPSSRAESIDSLPIQKLELEVILRIEQYTQSRQVPMPRDLITDIFKLSDNAFDLLMRNTALKIGHDNLIALVDFITKEGVLTPGEYTSKVISLIRHGLCEQLTNNSLTRKFYPCYKKLVAFDETSVMDHLLIPMLSKGIIVRPLYSEVNMQKLLERVLAQMATNALPLAPTTITVLNFCLEKETHLSKSSLEALFEIIQRASGHAMGDKLASFYFSIMKRFLLSMTELELVQMHSLNTYNSTIGKGAIDKMVEEQLIELRRAAAAQFSSSIPGGGQVCLWSPDNLNYINYWTTNNESGQLPNSPQSLDIVGEEPMEEA